MTTQKLKTLQAIFGTIMIVSLSTYIYMDWKLDDKGQYYQLAKGVFQISSAFTWHFIMVSQKINNPEKYKPNLHKILVGIWGVLGVIQIIDSFRLF